LRDVGEIGRESWRANGRRFGPGHIVVWFGHGTSPRDTRQTRAEPRLFRLAPRRDRLKALRCPGGREGGYLVTLYATQVSYRFHRVRNNGALPVFMSISALFSCPPALSALFAPFESPRAGYEAERGPTPAAAGLWTAPRVKAKIAA